MTAQHVRIFYSLKYLKATDLVILQTGALLRALQQTMDNSTPSSPDTNKEIVFLLRKSPAHGETKRDLCLSLLFLGEEDHADSNRLPWQTVEPMEEITAAE